MAKLVQPRRAAGTGPYWGGLGYEQWLRMALEQADAVVLGDPRDISQDLLYENGYDDIGEMGGAEPQPQRPAAATSCASADSSVAPWRRARAR